jgi:S-adenosylmethionine-dependent methyltransferase
MIIFEKIMLDDVSDIQVFYNSEPAREKTRLDRHQLEYDLTWCYLDQYLPSHGSILEIGCATGRYTLELAKRGYQLTAVDISAGLLDDCRKNLIQQGVDQHVRLIEADARDLSKVVDNRFDAVLLMGPLYHLVEESDRKMALRETWDCLREGGIIFSSFISRYGIMGDLLKKIPDWIEDQVEVQALLQSGKRPDDYPRGGFRGYFVQVSEIAPFHEALGFETLKVVGVEPVISADDESYNKLQGEQRKLWLNLLHELSNEISIIGASRHLLYIGRKK